jgi:hypothetical protein
VETGQPFGEVPPFVVTHIVRDGWPPQDKPITFVTDGVESAVEQAKAAAVLVSPGQMSRTTRPLRPSAERAPTPGAGRKEDG